MKKFIVILMLLASISCTKERQVRPEVDADLGKIIDRKITCADFPGNTCAISSEFQELADNVFAASTPEEPRHYVSILNDGQDALLARLHLIRAARKSIQLQTYIWVNDDVGRLIFFELLKAARRGVKVRIIVDQLGSAEEPGLLARLATAHENLEISFYNPTFSRGKTTPLMLTTGALFSFKKINQRMHNKVLIIDERIGIAGGRNIENKYYDYSTEYNFKDRDIIVIGPAVAHMGEIFDRYWADEVVVRALYLVDVGQEVIKLSRSDTRTLLDEPDFSLFSDIDNLANHHSLWEERIAIKPIMVGMVKYAADLPGKPSKGESLKYADSSSILRDVIGGAERSITIQTPYLVLSNRAKRMMKSMRKANPDLDINVSSNSLASTDLVMIYAMTFKQKREMIKTLKINLYEFKPFPEDARNFISRYDQLLDIDDSSEGKSLDDEGELSFGGGSGPRSGMHAKSIVVDSEIAVIGSHNLDPRSVNINTESMVIIWDQEIARDLEENILTDMLPRNSWIIAKRQKVPVLSFFSEIMGSISQTLPFLDIWPFRYSSSFQLREGAEPVPSDHPDFYQYYEDVGQFPGLNVSTKAVRTQLIKSFGGFLAPLM